MVRRRKQHCPKASLFSKGRWHGASRDGGIGRWHGASRDGGIDTPQPASAGSVPQFTMVVPRLRTVLAFGGPVFRPCGLRFALCPRGSSRFAAFDCALRYRLQDSFAHWTSASPVSATGGGEAPSPLGLLRAVSRTARALRAPLAFACAVFRACALRVLGTSALRAFTFLQAFAEKNTRNDVHAVISD